MFQEKEICEEEELLVLLVNGNERAFMLIYNRHRTRIYHVAMQYLKSSVLAQEVVQHVFMKLWAERQKINPKLPVEAWLYTVAKNNTLNQLKKLANEWKAIEHLKKTQVFEDDSLQNKIQDADYNKLLNEALDSLSEKQLVVYRLAREENLSYFQIAEQLNISPLTVKTHMSRALSHIKVFLSRYWN